ncbi:hypothetical protein ACQ4PT_003440 [Festuca glaucescens]
MSDEEVNVRPGIVGFGWALCPEALTRSEPTETEAISTHRSLCLGPHSQLPIIPRHEGPPRSSTKFKFLGVSPSPNTTQNPLLLLLPHFSTPAIAAARPPRRHPLLRDQAMKLKINKACDLASISVLPPRRNRGGGGGGASASASAAGAAASQQRSQSMSQKSFSQGGGGSFSQSVGASFSQGRGGGGALLSQGSGGGGAAFSQVGGGGGGGGSFSQGDGGGGAAFSQGGGGGGAAFSQGGGAAFSQGGGGAGAGAAFSQGGGGGAAFSQGGGSLSLLHSQSQISQASLDENLLSPRHPSPARDQRFALHDDSSKRMSSFPANSASSVRDESQLQMAKISSKAILRWNPSLPDSKCQVNEDVERKFQHVASSVHKMGMVLDSVQNDVMQLNRAMKEASLDSGSIQKKFVLVETSLQQILKGQDELKALLEGSTKSNPDQMSALNYHTSKLDEMSSTLLVLKQVQEDLTQLKGDIFRIFTKEMEGIVRAISSLHSRPDAMQAPTHLSCNTNRKSLINQASVESPLVNQRPVADGKQTPVAGRPQKKQAPVAIGRSRKKQAPVATGGPQKKQGRPQKKQAPEANVRPPKKQSPVANGRAQKKQTPVANGMPQMQQTAVAKGRPEMNHAQDACWISKTNQVPEANGKAIMKQVPAKKVLEAPKQEEVVIQMVNPQVVTKKVPSIIIDLDEEEGSDGGASCIIRKTETGAAGEVMCEEAMSEDAMEILRRARKRRRREENKAIVLFQD